MKNIFILFLAAICSISTAQTASAQNGRVALYRYTAAKSKNDVYAASPAHREYYRQRSYKEINVVGYVYLEKQPGTTALFHLLKKNADGTNQHFYTASFDEVLAKQDSEGEGVWIPEQFNKGIVGYVPAKAGNDAKSVVRFLQPDGKTNIYAFSKAEQNGLTANGLANQGTAFFVYAAAEQTANGGGKVDVQIGKITKVTDKSVGFMARSIGGDVAARGVAVEIAAYNADGSEAWRQLRIVKDALPQGKQVETVVDIVGDKSLAGLRFKLKLDGNDKIDEPLENNNESKMTDGPILNFVGSLIKTPVIIAKSSEGTVDLFLRKALYYNRSETARVLTASTYAAADGTMRLKKSRALQCAGDVCEFNLGFFAQRADGAGALETYAALSGATIGVVGNTIQFADGEKSKDAVFKVKLKIGENKIAVEIDPYKKTAEADENNNRFEATIVVEP